MGHDGGGLPRFHPDEFKDQADKLITSPSPPLTVADPVAPSGYIFYEPEDQKKIKAQIAARQAEEALKRVEAKQLAAKKLTADLISSAAVKQAWKRMDPEK